MADSKSPFDFHHNFCGRKQNLLGHFERPKNSLKIFSIKFKIFRKPFQKSIFPTIFCSIFAHLLFKCVLAYIRRNHIFESIGGTRQKDWAKHEGSEHQIWKCGRHIHHLIIVEIFITIWWVEWNFVNSDYKSFNRILTLNLVNLSKIIA